MRKLKNKSMIQCKTCSKFIYIMNKQICCGTSLLPTKEIVIKKPKEIAEVKKKKKHYHMDKNLNAAVLKRDGQRCTQCKSKSKLHVHHIVYRENGGTDDESNLITLCELCHAEAHRGESVYNIMIKRLFDYQVV